MEAYASVSDVGRCINPQQCEAQDEGAVMQGIGHTLLEEMVYEGGTLLNGNLASYRVPRAEDVPPRLESLFVENGDGAGPFGAKGVGEGSLIPVSPADRQRAGPAHRRAAARAAAHTRARLEGSQS